MRVRESERERKREGGDDTGCEQMKCEEYRAEGSKEIKSF